MYSKFNRHADSLPRGFVVNSSSDDLKYCLNNDKSDYESLGQKIRVSQDNGDVLGIKIQPEFDTDDSEDIDVNTVAKLDAYDVYEMGADFEPESSLPPPPAE